MIQLKIKGQKRFKNFSDTNVSNSAIALDERKKGKVTKLFITRFPADQDSSRNNIHNDLYLIIRLCG